MVHRDSHYHFRLMAGTMLMIIEPCVYGEICSKFLLANVDYVLPNILLVRQILDRARFHWYKYSIGNERPHGENLLHQVLMSFSYCAPSLRLRRVRRHAGPDRPGCVVGFNQCALRARPSACCSRRRKSVTTAGLVWTLNPKALKTEAVLNGSEEYSFWKGILQYTRSPR